MTQNKINPSAFKNELPLAPYKPGKKKVLVWSDSILTTTGFGTVSKFIINALYKTGLYEIDQLAINFVPEFYNRNEVPICIIPAKLSDPSDPYGNQMFLNALLQKDYDIVLIINDSFVVEGVARKIEEVRDTKRQQRRKVFNLVYYYPVDCHLLPQMSTMIKLADRSVAYTEFARGSSQLVGVFPTDVIYHGADTKNFYPLSPSDRKMVRKRYLNVDDDDKFIIVNVNRNSLRKNLAQSILAFHEFKKKVPNSMMYMHCRIEDGGCGHPVDLKPVLQELNIDITKDVIFPNKFNVAKGFPIQALNQLYNCGDCYLTTHTGEGFGLCVYDAMCTGVPVVVPDNTSMPEIVGDGRGYMYECKELAYIDNSGFRKVGRLEDILSSLFECYEDWRDKKPRREEIIRRATSFVQQNSWDNICKQWVKLFSELKDKPLGNPVKLEGENI